MCTDEFVLETIAVVFLLIVPRLSFVNKLPLTAERLVFPVPTIVTRPSSPIVPTNPYVAICLKKSPNVLLVLTSIVVVEPSVFWIVIVEFVAPKSLSLVDSVALTVTFSFNILLVLLVVIASYFLLRVPPINLVARPPVIEKSDNVDE